MFLCVVTHNSMITYHLMSNIGIVPPEIQSPSDIRSAASCSSYGRPSTELAPKRHPELHFVEQVFIREKESKPQRCYTRHTGRHTETVYGVVCVGQMYAWMDSSRPFTQISICFHHVICLQAVQLMWQTENYNFLIPI
jgi:hypothetical protein